MGRRERKKLQSRKMILEAAISEFSKKGYKDTSVADIMSAADLGIGTFYNYFNSKEDLLFSLLGRLGEAIRMALAEARAAERTSLELLEVGARVTAKFLDENRFVMPLFLSASHHGAPHGSMSEGPGVVEVPPHGAKHQGRRMTPQIKQVFTEIIREGQSSCPWISSRRCFTRSIRRRHSVTLSSHIRRTSRSRRGCCSTASVNGTKGRLLSKLCIVYLGDLDD